MLLCFASAVSLAPWCLLCCFIHCSFLPWHRAVIWDYGTSDFLCAAFCGLGVVLLLTNTAKAELVFLHGAEILLQTILVFPSPQREESTVTVPLSSVPVEFNTWDCVTLPSQSHLIIFCKKFPSCLKFQRLILSSLCTSFCPLFHHWEQPWALLLSLKSPAPSALPFLVMHSSGENRAISSLLIVSHVSFLVWCTQEVGCLWLTGGELMITHDIFLNIFPWFRTTKLFAVSAFVALCSYLLLIRSFSLIVSVFSNYILVWVQVCSHVG